MVVWDGVLKRIVVGLLSYVVKERAEEEGRCSIKYFSGHETCEAQE